MIEVKAQTQADIYWHKLNGVREITGKVTLTPEQFRKQLEQAVKHGYKNGHEDGVKSVAELRTYRENKRSAFGDFFGGM